ncbi:MAG: ATP-dependent Clp protease proteolytic subunit [Oscillibacter sp.]|nr:ATP-dependent Clp protease proteolytic subunit [Oscillibacter sp.]
MDTTPKILKETSSGDFLSDIRDEMLKNREVECFGPIDHDSVQSLIRQLRHLQRQDPEAEIRMYIDSPGGEILSGLALYDVMQNLSCPIRTLCVGQAASMAAVLFSAGARRELLPHSEVMIHDPLLSSGPGGSALQVQETARRLLQNRERLCGILAKHTGKSLEDICQRTKQDTFFTAEEAVDFGLADGILQTI